MIVVSYRLTAMQQGEEALEGALKRLASCLANQEGSVAAHVLHETERPGEFALLEFWENEDARRAAGLSMDKSIMAEIKAALLKPPLVTSYLAL